MSLSLLEFIRHIHDECVFISNATSGKTKEQFISDEILSRAIIRSLEIIGEATKRLPADFTERYPSIEWRKMAATRDFLSIITSAWIMILYGTSWLRKSHPWNRSWNK